MTEAHLHKQVCDLLSLALIPPAWFSTFPSDGATRRGRIGLKLGVPDILIIDRGFPLWIELKTGTGRVSTAQHDCHDALLQAGAIVAVCRSLDEVITVLRRHAVPLRPHKLAA